MFTELGLKITQAVARMWWLRWIFGFIIPPRKVFYVNGRFLYDNYYNQVILRGINLPLLDDWGFPGSDKLDQLEKTGANAVRIQWYLNYPPPKPGEPPRGPYAVADLDAFLEKCRTSRIIPIVELHDCTCKPDTNLVNTQLMPWWIVEALPVLLKHQRYLIINLANELGNYRWLPDPQPVPPVDSATQLNNFKTAYKTAIMAIRGAGLNMPIMIDAPDCGSSIDAFISIGQELINHDKQYSHDKQGSLLLSVHAYWGGSYDGMSHIGPSVVANLPIVFGEIANIAANDDGTDQCYYALDGTDFPHPPQTPFSYKDLLAYLTQEKIGWLAWSWYPDSCEPRRMTLDGNYRIVAGSSVGLTAYGNDIVDHPLYGLRLGSAKAERATSLPGLPPV